ncbi:NADH:flavin oxidoreductase/NADH oxidase family protein [Altererythrobacter sp. MF3-039]|uniref:NADH:flavin oxidoreductase/NADH oxidase family protein n=1 Tax=Altererythrobacter sp. MF3-039 TaxID=3252901 RepID=UPI00390C4764
MTDAIAQPLALACGQVLPNRLCKAAMTEGLADPRGVPDERLQRLYRRWSNGGIGLLLTGNVQVDRHHLERAGNVIIDGPPSRGLVQGLKAWAEASKSGGSKAWVQLSHAGRQTQQAINSQPKAPSAVPLEGTPGMKFGDPVALEEDEILSIADRFVLAAKVAEDTGFDGIQIHGAHGYLLSQFLSPKSNLRTDKWGGNLENRARLLLDIVERTTAQAGQGFAISVKLNSADFQRGAFDADDSEQVAGWLDERGIDLLEVSGGTYEQAAMMGASDASSDKAKTSTAQREAYFLEFAPRMRAAVKNAALMVTGGFRSRAGMNAAIRDDKIDVIGVGRPLLGDPEGPAKLLAGAPELRRIESELRIGPGWLSPKSPFAIAKMLNMGATLGWCYEQMDRLGDGKDIDHDGKIFRALLAYQKREKAKAEAMREAGTI